MRSASEFDCRFRRLKPNCVLRNIEQIQVLAVTRALSPDFDLLNGHFFTASRLPLRSQRRSAARPSRLMLRKLGMRTMGSKLPDAVQHRRLVAPIRDQPFTISPTIGGQRRVGAWAGRYRYRSLEADQRSGMTLAVVAGFRSSFGSVSMPSGNDTAMGLSVVSMQSR